MPLLEMLRSKWLSLLWAVGFAAFLVPCAVPGAERYTSGALKPGDQGISFYVLIIFVGTICLYYWGLLLYRDYRAKKEEDVGETGSALQNEDNEKYNKEAAKEDKKNGGTPSTSSSHLSHATTEDIEEGGPPSAHYDATKQQGEGEDKEGKEENEEPLAAVHETKAITKKQRSYFLDNVKVFLTIIVLMHHLVIGFGGDGGWTLRIGNFESTYFWLLSRFFLGPNQGYFMSCFFFISAYFVPRSFAKKGRVVFIKERAQRIFVGAAIVTFGIQPLSIYLAFAVGFPGFQVGYNVNSGTVWFLWWLLLFNLWYAFTASTGQNQGAKIPFSRYFQKIPGFASRWLAGIVICGILQLIINYYLLRGSSVAAMPNAQGALTCDLLFFYVGLLAGENQWFAADKPKIREQIGMNVWLFRALVLAEYAVIGLQPWLNNSWPFYSNVTMSESGQGIITFIFYGIWCVDMSLAVLEFFQSFVDYCNPLSLWLANEAYGAYLLQNITITLAVAVFAWTYNGNPTLEFEIDGGAVSHTPIPIPTLVTALIYAILVWVPLTWGLAYFFKKMPLLEHVL